MVPGQQPAHLQGRVASLRDAARTTPSCGVSFTSISAVQTPSGPFGAYLFEIDTALFLSNKRDLTARFEGELDQRVTQRLILQPRAEVNLSAQDIPELGIGSGLDSLEAGIRLRYEISREFAPYIGIEQEWKFGGSRDFARAAGEDPSVTNYVVGIRFWF